LSYLYNHHLGRWPSRTLRRAFLKGALGACGKGTSVQMDCKFLQPRKVYLGERNVINFGCILDGRRHAIHTGNDVSIGPEAAILTLGHDPQSPDFSDKGGEVVIGDQAWICFRAIILPEVSIGEGAVVAAGAVVSRDVEPYTIVAGCPAKPVGPRNKDLRYSCGFAPWLV
jgi:acetyltransferase-like isoleucine patch superfamily enzyme